jgi:dienelactone hydrolase
MSKQRKAPKGCYWRDGVLYGRIQVTGGPDIRWSLRTDDPKIAASRRKAERDRVVAAQHYGDQRRTFAAAMEAWGRFIADKISGKTLTRYLSSLAVLRPFLEGAYLDEIDKKLVGSIVESRRDNPYVPRGKRHPIRVSIATIKRDLTALSSVFDFCVDEEWMPTNPAMEWLKPGHRKKSRLQERRIEFARRGFAALVVLRRGYGSSPGGRADSYGPCNHPDYRAALAVSVADLPAAIAAMKNRNDVTTQGMIAIGHSAGGLATVGLTAQAPPGLVAAISFAGGRGSRSPDTVCGDRAPVDLFGQLGTTSRVPMLWVYARNDGFFSPALAHRFRDAFAASGGQVSFIDAPAFGDDGHYLLSTRSASTWTPYVDTFLRAH